MVHRLAGTSALLAAVAAAQPPPWPRHAIEGATALLQGADGVRLGDANGDGRPDIVTAWEEGKAVRAYLHPGTGAVRAPWPAVTVGEVPSGEDAVWVDLDGDGNLDVVSCTEGRERTVYVHWAPHRDRLLDSGAWRTAPIPVTRGAQQWMFALPMQVDGRHGIDLVVGSKGKAGSVSWLRSPKDPRALDDWTLHRIVDAGWIMTLRAAGDAVWVSDRRGRRRGVFRLVPSRPTDGAVTWRREDAGGRQNEVMFMDLWPDSGTPVVATRDGVILDLRGEDVRRIPNPLGVPFGKAVRIGDIDGDGAADIVHTANTRKVEGRIGVSWLRRGKDGWIATDISGTAGSKFDRIELVDLDADGDLDVLTCEEHAGADSRGLGVVWYENPRR